MKLKSEKEIVRFWGKVDKKDIDDCWEWIAGKDRYGYGQFTLRGKVYRSHRIAFENECCPIPDGMHVLHKCDEPNCVNPNHLFLGTHAENMADMVKKGRHQYSSNKHNFATLTEIDIPLIRLWKERKYKIKTIALAYGVSYSTIWNVLRGETWNYIK